MTTKEKKELEQRYNITIKHAAAWAGSLAYCQQNGLPISKSWAYSRVINGMLHEPTIAYRTGLELKYHLACEA